MGGIVPVVNVTASSPAQLVLDGPTLANIFLGEIKSWDDPAIAKLNPGVKLPKQAIAIVHRSDGSGTTFNFAYYLAEVSPTWKSKVGVNTSVRLPGRHRRQGQRRRRQQRRQHPGLDRLRRIRLCAAEQADLRQDDQQGRQGRVADVGNLPGRRRQRGLEVAAGLRRAAGEPAGRRRRGRSRRRPGS